MIGCGSFNYHCLAKPLETFIRDSFINKSEGEREITKMLILGYFHSRDKVREESVKNENLK